MKKQKKTIEEKIIERFRKRFGRFYCDAVKQEVDMEGNLIVGSGEIEEWIVDLLREERKKLRKAIKKWEPRFKGSETDFENFLIDLFESDSIHQFYKEKEKTKHFKSVFENEQELLKAIIDIHLKGKPIECDPMYFKGNFYKNGVKEPEFKFDIRPQVLGVEKADARKLPIENESISSMILDPPFMFGGHGKQKEYYSSQTHGFLSWKQLQELYQGILKEAYRVLKKKGILIFKCQDYTDSKTTMTHCLVYNWATEIGFYAKDIAILVKPNKVYNPNTIQRHLRKIHTYFWIFEKR